MAAAKTVAKPVSRMDMDIAGKISTSPAHNDPAMRRYGSSMAAALMAAMESSKKQ